MQLSPTFVYCTCLPAACLPVFLLVFLPACLRACLIALLGFTPDRMSAAVWFFGRYSASGYNGACSRHGGRNIRSCQVPQQRSAHVCFPGQPIDNDNSRSIKHHRDHLGRKSAAASAAAARCAAGLGAVAAAAVRKRAWRQQHTCAHGSQHQEVRQQCSTCSRCSFLALPSSFHF